MDFWIILFPDAAGSIHLNRPDIQQFLPGVKQVTVTISLTSNVLDSQMIKALAVLCELPKLHNSQIMRFHVSLSSFLFVSDSKVVHMCVSNSSIGSTLSVLFLVETPISAVNSSFC